MLLCSCHTERKPLDTEVIYAPRHAKGFEVVRDKTTGERLLRIDNPWQGATDVVFYTPLERAAQRIVAMSSSYVAMLDAIGCGERIVGISGTRFISTPNIVKRIDEGAIAEVGYDGAFDFEKIRAMQSDLVLLYGVAGEAKMLSNKLKTLDIPYIYIGDYIEETPLGKAEWVVALAYLCGCEERGKALFDGVEERYNALRNRRYCSAYRPRVMLNTPYRDSWFMPPVNSYMVHLIEDAGGDYIYKENNSTSSKPISLEEALLLAEGCDFWLNVGQYTSLDELCRVAPHFAGVDAVKHRRVYNNTRRTTPNGGSDFWESGAVHPDLILADLIKILHYEAKSEELYYYEQLQ